MTFGKYNHLYSLSQDIEHFLVPRKFPQYPSAVSLPAPLPALDNH